MFVVYSMLLTRRHANIECSIKLDAGHCTISIKVRENRQGSFLYYQEMTLDQAKAVADDAVLKSGHICSEMLPNTHADSNVLWRLQMSKCPACKHENPTFHCPHCGRNFYEAVRLSAYLNIGLAFALLVVGCIWVLLWLGSR
jgi:hypothetical protein